MYDWSNGLGVWTYNTSKHFYINRDTYLPSNTYINNSAVCSITSNTNGTSIRYYNGVQICYHTISIGSITASSMANAVYSNSNINSRSFTFPQAFSAAPSVTGNCCGSGYIACQVASVVATSCILRAWLNYSSTPDGLYMSYIAVGRWK